MTDRCNLRCQYCMPEIIEHVPMSRILTYEEIAELADAATECGIDRFKLTGGEPLMRRGISELIGLLKANPRIKEVTMTTNGVLLEQYLSELIESGLGAVNISLDSLERSTYEEITGHDALEEVLSGMDAAVKSALPVKVNCVLLKGVNSEEWRELAELAHQKEIDVRFIEMMPIGYGKHFEAFSNKDILEALRREFPGLKVDGAGHGNGPSSYVKPPDFKGSIGFISAMHGKFCSSCNRIRLTSMGDLKPCLCYGAVENIKAVFSEKESEFRRKRLREAVERTILSKPKAHCFEERGGVTEDKKMVQIGG